MAISSNVIYVEPNDATSINKTVSSVDENGNLEEVETSNMIEMAPPGHISPCRGGYDKVGSPVWADMREIAGDNTVPPTADYSIFGHTQLLQASITPRWADLDCRKAFILTPNLKLIKV